MIGMWSLIPLISSLSYVALLTLALPSIKRRINRVFAYYLGVAAAWSLTSFMLHLNAFPQLALLWNELVVVGLFGTVITYYHFVRAYADKPAGKGVYLGYALVSGLAVLSLNGYIVKSAYVIDGVLYHDLGNSLYLIGAVVFVYVGMVMHLLIKKYRGSTDQVERNRTAYLMTGWSTLTILGSTNLVDAVAGFPIDHVGSLANALIIAYAIGRYRLLDMRFIVRKGLMYSGLTIFLTAVYLLLLFLFYVSFQSQSWSSYAGVGLAAAFALLVAIAFNPLRNITQEWVDHLFYRDTYDYRRMVLGFSSKMANVLDLRQLAEGMLQSIGRGMHVEQAALLFPSTGGSDFGPFLVQPDASPQAFGRLRLEGDSPIVVWLTQEGRPLSRELIDILPQFKGLWEVERNDLKAAGVELFCPIPRKDNLIGILALGKKKSDAPYSDEEMELLMAMANEASIAIENAKMLDSLKKQQLHMEQLLAQMVNAQEEERQRVCLELHDSVAQWLVSVSYRVQTCSQLLNGDQNGEVRRELTAIEDSIDRSLKELRGLMAGLRPPILDELGLTHALRRVLEDLQADGITCYFEIVGTPVRLPSSREIATYRIVQEALNNVKKHAGASEVSLNLCFREYNLLVEVRDNGRGFNLSQTLDSAVSIGHMGLLGMKQRAEMMGGVLKFETGKGAGTHIMLVLPIGEEAERGG